MTNQDDILEQIELSVSLDAAELFHAAFAGQRLFLPASGRLKPENRVVKALGPDLAHAIVEVISPHSMGSYIDVPSCAKQEGSRRVDRVLRSALEGKSANEIAAEVGITRRSVFRIKKQLRKEGFLQ